MTSDEGKHVMLSYNHKSKNIVIQVKEELENNGIPVWYDERDMEDNMFRSMPKAVGNAFAVGCFLTPEYENSRNCELELEHAQRRGKRIIPCMVTNRKVWKPSSDGWLNFITGSIIAIDFSGTSVNGIDVAINNLIKRINEKPSDSSTSSLPKPSDSATSSLPPVSKPNDFFLPIRHEYVRNSRIQRMMNEEKSFPIEQSYINLAIVETEEQREKEKKLRQAEHNDAIISSFEEIYGTKTSIDVKDILKKCKDQTKKVLVLGRAGIGKSTFCRYVSYQWAKKELWTEYQLVILIRLRLLTSDRYPQGQRYFPVDLVEKEYFPFDTIPDKDRQTFKELCNKGQVLWLLDGYDEFVQNIPKQLKDSFDHILKTQHHILTSRPYSITLSYDVKMEITGFTDDNIAKYVELFFDQIKDQLPNTSSEIQKLLGFLKTNPGIWGVAHIPINLELISSLWVDIDKSEANIFTVTRLYDTMVEWLCRRYLTKQDIDNTNMKKKTVYARCQKELAFLESLAFNGMEDNCIILRSYLLEKTEKETDCSLEDHPELLRTGILHSLNDKPIGCHIKSQIDYYFLHLSFQEHFAARYLVNALSSPSPQQAIEFIKNNKYNQRFVLVFTFASGLLNDDVNLKQSLNKFWDFLLTEPLDLVNFKHTQLIISCLGEVSEQIEIPHSTELIDSIRKWIKYVLSTSNKTLCTQLTNSLQRTASIVRESAIKNQLIELMNCSESCVKLNTCELISALSTYNSQQEFISSLTHALEDEDSSLRRSACQALGETGEKAATSEVISKLANALRDEEQNVGYYACDALCKIGEKAATNEVISQLVNALGYWHVQNDVCHALGKMGEKAATSEVINKLVNELEHKHGHVNDSVCDALAKIGTKAATSEVISKLLNALGDENKYVRNRACETLKRMGEKAATNEAINKLVNALGDESWDVRKSACRALERMGENAATSEVINKLVNALEGESQEVRRTACKALCTIGEKAATSEVISKLVNALGHENSDVRQTACEALYQMSEKAATNEVINKLMNALGDESWEVRGSACEALAKIGEKAATSEVISKLLNALGHENKAVRESACRALKRMGENAATSEVISKLANALGDEDGLVRGTACEALGEMGEKAATGQVISKLVNALGDESSYVGHRACKALGGMGEKAATNEAISKLVNALGHENKHVIEFACEALGQMGEKAATNEVINKLANALGDEGLVFRQIPYEALGKMGEKAATSEVISKLVNALGVKDVRVVACKALGQMGEKAATSEVINKLVNAPGDGDWYFVKTACEALSQMGEKAATSKVISMLGIVLGNEVEEVRQIACNALVKMSEKAATNEVISMLANALGDENSDVRETACEALCQIGEKAATNEVIKKLLELTDEGYAYYLYKVLEKFFTSFTMMAVLDSATVGKLLLCLDQNLLKYMRFEFPELFIKVFLHTKDTLWLSVATRVAFFEGVCVTIVENTIVVYHSKEPVEPDRTNEKLVDQLVNAFVEQASKLDLPCMRGRKAHVSFVHKEESLPPCDSFPNAYVKRKRRSGICNVL